MISNEADSKTYVMQTNQNHAQEFAKVAPELGSNTAERHDTATHYMQRTSGKQIRTRVKLCGTKNNDNKGGFRSRSYPELEAHHASWFDRRFCVRLTL